MNIPATKLRGENGRWERPPTCCLVDQIADSNPDEDECDESQMEVCLEQDPEELSHCDDEPEDDDYENGEFKGPNNMEIDQTESEPREEAESNVGGEQLHAESETEMNDETLPQQTQDNKRKTAEQDQSSSQEPLTKHQKLDTVVSKTAKALEQVLGTCEEVQKFDKLKQNVGKNPKSRYHIERFEAHLVKVQILTLKAYKKLFNDIQTWKKNFKSSNQRDSTEDDIRTNILIATKRKQVKTASELLKLWKITLHLV